ncbi:hypothetical protein [Cylindrospermum sp. FACHB-282]|uniref:hypothetical protein n=1 Tax=Cylindrospermum sp. FACHB-282 TaxID=2692794 RepID=UPI001682043E|nr:hypothetical protein [Cylindrospermum sp. FACHB-282]MBD2388439.1 hypothetical protein [Cylindrospermum sp. FACHB-282]
MTEVTGTAAFGTSHTQDINTVSIAKTDLAVEGLTPTASNKAEGIIAALFKKWMPLFTADGYNSNLEQSITITYQQTSSGERSDGTRVLVDAYLVEFTTIDTRGGVDPDAM